MTDVLESWTGLVFVDPAMLWLVVLPLLSWLTALRSARRRAPAVAQSFDVSELPSSLRARLVWLPTALHALATLMLIAALARPVRRDPSPQRSEGIDILLCVDVSSSMDARDLDAESSRLDVAKRAAARFVDARPHDRIGLLAFAAYADVLCPPTLDHAALADRLGELALVEAGGREDLTGIGTALARAARVLAASDAPSKVVILLTDGEENVATPDRPEEIGPLEAAQLAREWGVRLYVISAIDSAAGGVGSGGPMAGLESVASVTAGRAFAARDAAALAAVYDAIDRMETVELAEPDYALVEKFAVFVVVALVLFALARALAATVLEVLP